MDALFLLLIVLPQRLRFLGLWPARDRSQVSLAEVGQAALRLIVRSQNRSLTCSNDSCHEGFRAALTRCNLLRSVRGGAGLQVYTCRGLLGAGGRGRSTLAGVC